MPGEYSICEIPAEDHSLNLTTKKCQTNPNRGTPFKNHRPVIFKIIKVMKIKKRQRKHSRPKQLPQTCPNAACDSELDHFIIENFFRTTGETWKKIWGLDGSDGSMLASWFWCLSCGYVGESPRVHETRLQSIWRWWGFLLATCSHMIWGKESYLYSTWNFSVKVESFLKKPTYFKNTIYVASYT